MSSEPVFNLVTGDSWDDGQGGEGEQAHTTSDFFAFNSGGSEEFDKILKATERMNNQLANTGLDELIGEVGVKPDEEEEVNLMAEFVREDEGNANIKKPVIRGMRLDTVTWRRMVNMAALIGRQGGAISVKTLKENLPDIETKLIDAVIRTENFARILEYRGVIDDRSPVGMSERQMMAINAVTNFTDTRKMRNKLRSIGITDSEFQQWLSTDCRFRRVFRSLSEQMFEEAQGAVNIALTTGAVDGDIRFIKYFNEMSGRFDPAARNVADVRTVLSAVVEVLTSTIKDPELLREVAGKLSAVMVTTGLTRKEIA